MNGLGTCSRALVRANQLHVAGWRSKTKYLTLSLISWVTNVHVSPNSVLLTRFMDLVLAAAHSVEGSHVQMVLHSIMLHFFFGGGGRCGPTRAMASSFLRFLDHTQRRITVSRTPLYEWSARRRDLYLTTHNTHKRQTSIFPVGFEPTISEGERP